MSTSKQRIPPIAYITPFLLASSKDEDDFVLRVERRLNHDTRVVPLGRARTGIYLLTRFAIQGGRQKIILSPYTTEDVVNMVQLAGENRFL